MADHYLIAVEAAHTMVTWGLPSGFRVTRCARAADSRTALALSGSDLMA